MNRGCRNDLLGSNTGGINLCFKQTSVFGIPLSYVLDHGPPYFLVVIVWWWPFTRVQQRKSNRGEYGINDRRACQPDFTVPKMENTVLIERRTDIPKAVR